MKIVLKLMAMMIKGTVSAYSHGKLLLSQKRYLGKDQRIKAMECMQGIYREELSYFIIRPSMQGDTTNVSFALIPDRKVEIERPKAIYSNPKSPFGIADEFHNNKT